jgi:hypothetical protein
MVVLSVPAAAAAVVDVCVHSWVRDEGVWFYSVKFPVWCHDVGDGREAADAARPFGEPASWGAVLKEGEVLVGWFWSAFAA